MSTTASADSTTAPPCCSMFTSTQLVQSFPHHDTVKLDENNFVQWQQHIRLITKGYNLTQFLEGTLPAPSRFVQSLDGFWWQIRKPRLMFNRISCLLLGFFLLLAHLFCLVSKMRSRRVTFGPPLLVSLLLSPVRSSPESVMIST
ncbi:hypothetical protein PVK06_034169 [Gossypium arboreum]|uniref:Retrotransposon Copia-like N-terminal domain-containing protein n=1 Tax=Gossypium arboreum TaxID=29729 RepID=A0ABR0NE04_GOSAR|nr:hypothetical protein PVK06_034169 [Gossypium arboreum]